MFLVLIVLLIRLRIILLIRRITISTRIVLVILLLLLLRFVAPRPRLLCDASQPGMQAMGGPSPLGRSTPGHASLTLQLGPFARCNTGQGSFACLGRKVSARLLEFVAPFLPIATARHTEMES